MTNLLVKKSLLVKKALLPLVGVALLSGGSFCAWASDPSYSAAKEQAKAEYKTEKEHCDTLSGNDKDVCIKAAKAKLTAAEADAKAQHKAGDARADATEDKQTAEYKVAKERCDNFSGSEKDACVDRAKAKYKQ